MRAAVFHGAGDVRIETVGDPDAPSPDELVLEVTRAAICGTDAAEWDHGPVLCQVRMLNESPLIPDFDWLERMISEETRAA